MPGPISSSYDPVWGTAENADMVRDGIRDAEAVISRKLGQELRFILDVAREQDGPNIEIKISERKLRLLRFACRVALEEDEI
ncbi:MAG: hypothetical protein M0R50_09885 [Candidatus Cloacimonetes bacterium]|jgi:hypothetical protein|nr:hypothetical protein [Candidatus Cloacimonadota bacterium]